ncbi:hypothetical protein ASPZODRAFT_1165843 [Penicilliopsis zonata CBS 506.65]|uniref:Zn(2)-C6 fungal-type domain-containing protein n=1 Tax=Penicilliopsis zonata CBS 506.65 TaxID=1073090 RepID=A0A1L9STD1_9EURO|nr:hypothetical protein ASPZODRAFT_1165843 [Penicilliopsis zonata CBS 506.65]OJJ50396.1 hypothetical protein ASPZODRAFT_1165843 [Penicilliopsis zonata CBS 506.65]
MTNWLPSSPLTTTQTTTTTTTASDSERQRVRLQEAGMEDERSSDGWRISKACQECRRRKIKCNGHTPCKTCQLRKTPCLYRDITRQRRKKTRDAASVAALSASWAASDRAEASQASPGGTGPEDPSSPGGPSQGRNDNNNNNTTSSSKNNHHHLHLHNNGTTGGSSLNPFHSSVSATHMATPSCEVQLYYGPTSHFSLMQHIYRDLITPPHVEHHEPHGGVDEASAGIDLFSFRRIFFGGTAGETRDVAAAAGAGAASAGAASMFMPYPLAQEFLRRYLSTLYHLTPFKPRAAFEYELEQLYYPSWNTPANPLGQSILLLALALGSQGTEQYHWGELLFDRAKALTAPLDDVVNLQAVQVSLLMAHYQTEMGRPNSSFLHLGTAVRKAFSAGLHKEAAANNHQEGMRKIIEERRVTLWGLYFYETWCCFYLGRPSSLSLKDIDIAYPEDPFLLALIRLTKATARSAEEMYGERHESLLQMWRVARSISNDLKSFEPDMQRALGFGLDKPAQQGDLGARQTILLTLYYHIILLTYRPFLIFRGRLQRGNRSSSSAAANRPIEIPTWLNEACNNALYSARRTIHHLCEAATINDLAREIRYHGFFLGSSCLCLLYDMLNVEGAACTHLPWIHAGMNCLASMRAGEPVISTVAPLQAILKSLNPAYEWIAPASSSSASSYQHAAAAGSGSNATTASLSATTSGSGSGYASMMNYLPGLRMAGVGALDAEALQEELQFQPSTVKSSDDLPDFTQSEMGFDFDFSTMDLEAFLSLPGMDVPVPSTY